jgi:hypothetical protein
MPQACAKACLHCQQATTNGYLCDDCRRKSKEHDEDRRITDPIRALYASVAWRRFRAWILSFNPVCQALVEHPTTMQMEQCHAAATEVHHIISPRERRDLMFTASNVICLCTLHHHKGQGEPTKQRDPAKYVPTRCRQPHEAAAHDVN